MPANCLDKSGLIWCCGGELVEFPEFVMALVTGFPLNVYATVFVNVRAVNHDVEWSAFSCVSCLVFFRTSSIGRFAPFCAAVAFAPVQRFVALVNNLPRSWIGDLFGVAILFSVDEVSPSLSTSSLRERIRLH